MPIVTVTNITRPEHAVEYLAQYIDDSTLDIQKVFKYDEVLTPVYPSVQLYAGGFSKDLHGTKTWLLTIRVDIYIMHAKLTEDRATRNYEDLALATGLVAYLEDDLTLGGRVIAGWVEQEQPGAMPPRSSRMPAVVSTRLHWRGTNESRFK